MSNDASAPARKVPEESLFRRAWDRWLKIAHILGTVQMAIILTLVYWFFMTLLFLPFGLIADPLRLRPGKSGWVRRAPVGDPQTYLRSQG
ncbi:MAG: hypothetical protein FJ319_01330 [SAR202 cluster bacterium]|nr:hypothetical protein [SAR202 cluster bacterium]